MIYKMATNFLKNTFIWPARFLFILFTIPGAWSSTQPKHRRHEGRERKIPLGPLLNKGFLIFHQTEMHIIIYKQTWIPSVDLWTVVLYSSNKAGKMPLLSQWCAVSRLVKIIEKNTQFSSVCSSLIPTCSYEFL